MTWKSRKENYQFSNHYLGSQTSFFITDDFYELVICKDAHILKWKASQRLKILFKNIPKMALLGNYASI